MNNLNFPNTTLPLDRSNLFIIIQHIPAICTILLYILNTDNSELCPTIYLYESHYKHTNIFYFSKRVLLSWTNEHGEHNKNMTSPLPIALSL